MPSLLSRRLIVVTGKGGVGKTTIAAAIGMLATRHQMRTLIVDLADGSRRLQEVFAEQSSTSAQAPNAGGTPNSFGATSAKASSHGGAERRQVAPLLSVSSIDPEAAMLEWMQQLGGRLPARMLASRASFQYFAAAAPGARELVCLAKISRLAAGTEGDCDLVVLDAPATGHVLGLLASPRTFASIARVGPVAEQADQLAGLLSDPQRTGYVAVTQATEMAVTETLELDALLQAEVSASLSRVIVNATIHRRFTGEELRRIEGLRSAPTQDQQRLAGDSSAAGARLAEAAANAANAVHVRTRSQHSHIARLRRAGHEVITVPFVFERSLDLDAIARIADLLEGRL